MTTNRELLELAAKAAGIALDCTIREDGKPFYHSDRNAFAIADGGWFAPLTDDGDALRLAVKLKMDVKQWESNSIAVVVWDKHATEDATTNRYTATRRAIVRAAAEIGKDKP